MSDTTVGNTKTVTLHELRKRHARSDFEKLLLSQLLDSKANVEVIESYEIAEADVAVTQNLKEEIKGLQFDGSMEWADDRHFQKQIQKGSIINPDVYVKFPRDTELTLQDFLGGALEEHAVLNAGESNGSTSVENNLSETDVWIEVCVKPAHARHKLFQLLRSRSVLKPKGKVIGAICLNEEFDEFHTVAQLMQSNDYVKNIQGMKILMIWTKHRNIILRIGSIEKGIRHLERRMMLFMVVLLVVSLVVSLLLNAQVNTKIDTKFDQVIALLNAKQERDPIRWLARLVGRRGGNGDLAQNSI